jgi:hypothetical protein
MWGWGCTSRTQQTDGADRAPRKYTATIRSDSERFGAIRSDSERFGEIRSDSERFGAIRSDSERFGAIRSDSERFGAIRSDSERFGAIRSDSERFGFNTKPLITRASWGYPACARSFEMVPTCTSTSENTFSVPCQHRRFAACGWCQYDFIDLI